MEESSIFNEVKLCHGSKGGLVLPIEPRSRKRCDFGSGFYLGDKEIQPKGLIARFPTARFYECRLDLAGLRVKKFSEDRNGWLTWALFVAFNRGVLGVDLLRKKFSDWRYDVIIGRIADDSMMQVMNEFFDGAINDKTFIAAMKCMDLGNQYVCKTKKACRRVRVISERGLTEEERAEALVKEQQRVRDMSSAVNEIRLKYRHDNAALYYDEILERLEHGL